MDKPLVVSSKSGRGVKKITPVEIYLVNYEDGEGKDNARLVVRAEVQNEKKVFIMQEKIGGSFVINLSSQWFEDDMNKALEVVSAETSTTV